MTNMIDEKLLKKANENAIKNRTKAKLNTGVFEVGQKLEFQIAFAFQFDSIFVKFQTLNKYSLDVRKEEWTIKGWIICSRLNYCKVKNTETPGIELDEIAQELVWMIDKKALKKSNYEFFNDNCFY